MGNLADSIVHRVGNIDIPGRVNVKTPRKGELSANGRSAIAGKTGRHDSACGQGDRPGGIESEYAIQGRGEIGIPGAIRRYA